MTRIVAVTWEDAAQRKAWDRTEPYPETMIAETVGFLIDRDAKRLVVGGEYFAGDDSYRDVTVIPAVNVRKMRVLR